MQTALEVVYQLSVPDLSYTRLQKCAAAVAGRVARAAAVPDPGLDDAAAVRGEEHAADAAPDPVPVFRRGRGGPKQECGAGAVQV